MSQAQSLKKDRDSHVIQLWRILSALSQEVGSEGMSDEDLNLFVECTKHSAIQTVLDKAQQELKERTGHAAIQSKDGE